MRVLGIDYGDSRIGIAISDPLGWTAQALETITWRSDVEVPLKRISELVEEYGVKTVIVGFPKNMDGTVGAREKRQ